MLSKNKYYKNLQIIEIYISIKRQELALSMKIKYKETNKKTLTSYKVIDPDLYKIFTTENLRSFKIFVLFLDLKIVFQVQLYLK